jgi:hypothetical protein
MRRFVGALLITLVAAAVLSGTASAKEGGVELSSTPVGMSSGDPWTPQLQLVDGTPELLAQAKPGVPIRNVDTEAKRTFAATSTADPQVWNVRVVFPSGGWWLVEAFDGVTGRSYPIGGQWLIAEPKGVSAPPAASSDGTAGGSFPVWPVTGGALAFFFALVGAALFLRRQRFGLSH